MSRVLRVVLLVALLLTTGGTTLPAAAHSAPAPEPAANQLPVVGDDAYATDEDQPLIIDVPGEGVLANDEDPEGDDLVAGVESQPSNGTLTLNADGTLAYEPDPDFSGEDSFTYSATDEGTVANRAPIANADFYSPDEDTPVMIAAGEGVLANDTDPDGDALTAELVSDAVNGTLTLNVDGGFTYAPDANYSGPDSFTYVASDGELDSASTTVGLNVLATDDAPMGVADNYTTPEDVPLTVTAPGVLANDSDPDDDALTATLLADVAHGSLILDANGGFQYAPDGDYNGQDSFTYVTNDGTATGEPTTVSVNVTAVNDRPVGVADSFTTAEDVRLDVTAPGFLGNDTDADGDVLTAYLNSQPTNGFIGRVGNDGSFDYYPNPGFVGTDSFSYEACDRSGCVLSITVTITVTAVNTAPVVLADSYETTQDELLSVPVANGVLVNDTDSDGDTLTAELVDDVENGELTLGADGSFDYQPNKAFSGTDAFRYQASDGGLASETVAVTITVSPTPNTAPVATEDAYETEDGTPLTISAPGLLANDTDADGDALTAVGVDQPGWGVVTVNTDGSFTYEPDPGFTGVDRFTYQASDGTDVSADTNVTITVVEPANSPPVTAADA